MKNNIVKFYLIVVLAVMMYFTFSESVHASDLDALIGGSENTQVEQSEVVQQPVDTTPSVQAPVNTTNSVAEESKSGTNTLLDVLQGQNGLTDESVKQANALASPLIKIMNLLTSFLVVLAIASITCMTALDLFFLALPPVRGLMYPMYSQLTQGGGMQGGMMSPMGGGFGGFGRGYGMMGGMGGQSQPQVCSRRQFISDDAVKAIGLTQPQQQQSPMGMGMGMGMGMMQQSQQPVETKIAIVEYLKLRTIFIIVFTFAAVFLTSSILTGYGLKLFSFVQEQLLKFL